MRNGASDMLYRTEGYLPPLEVFDLVEGEVSQEIDQFTLDPNDQGDRVLMEQRELMLSAIRECRQLYAEHGVDAFELMQESSNRWSQLIGEALASENYMPLAI